MAKKETSPELTEEFKRILYLHSYEGTPCRVHSRLPKLFLVHFAETLIALKLELAVIGVSEVFQSLVVVKVGVGWQSTCPSLFPT